MQRRKRKLSIEYSPINALMSAHEAVPQSDNLFDHDKYYGNNKSKITFILSKRIVKSLGDPQGNTC
jgi:hypothetical protein